jgi:hypothetical protein
MDLTQLPLDQIAAALFALAGLVFLAGIGRALVSASVLWTYAGHWITANLLPAFVLIATAAVGQGVPALHLPADPLVGAIFAAGSVAYVASAVASIATSLGVDPAALPRSSNAVDPTADN